MGVNCGMQLATVISATVLLFQLSVVCKAFEITKDPSIGATSCPGQPNTIPPWTGMPTLLKEVANGSLYTVGEDDDQIYGKNCNLSACFSH